MWARMHVPIRLDKQRKCREVREVSVWGEGNTSVENAWHLCHTTRTPVTCREAPHMGFSSEAVASCSTVQWALPLIVTARHSLYHSHYFGRGCAGHFSILITGRHLPPRPGHTPSSPIKQSHSRGQSRVCFPLGDPITHLSFTFRSRLLLFPSERHGCVTAFPSFASFSHSLIDIHNILSLT